ncbi:hypothetical protein HJD18_01635 [Thermoleophilia bacterium SCSIO 60948]|nr:hypothetical protein HJD18_01635 [Thermoleophilia bacterium SCSIO 60948]
MRTTAGPSRREARPSATAPSGSSRSAHADPIADFGPDYLDRFSVGADPRDLPARDWARRSLAGAEAANAAFGRLVWGGLLGFDLDRGAPGTMFGWRVTGDSPDELVIDTDGSRMAGRMVFAHFEGELVWTTMLRFHGSAGRRIWGVAGNAHRFIAPRALESAKPSR